MRCTFGFRPLSKHKDSKFSENVRRGRRFEAEEKAGWNHIPVKRIHFEASTIWSSKRGRIDIKIDENDGSVTIIEIKSTNWDALSQHRIRCTSQHHARQLWRYINDYLLNQSMDVCAGIIYENEPNNRQVGILVEQVLNDQGIQVVWRNTGLSQVR
jgi:hypothetical protein